LSTYSASARISASVRRAAQVVLIEAGDDHPDAAIGELRGQLGERFVEKLRFVDADYLDAQLELGAQLAAVAHRGGVELALVARDQAAGT
jgi:hypothetical protein